MKKSHILLMSTAVILGVASVTMAIAVNSSDAVAAEVAGQLAAGSATHIATTIITGALVVAAGILWYLSFHRKHTELKEAATQGTRRSNTNASRAKSNTKKASQSKTTANATSSRAKKTTTRSTSSKSGKSVKGKSTVSKATKATKTSKSSRK